jgi:hypothetical protein
MQIAEGKRHNEIFFARLKILLQNRTLNSNPIEGFINVTHSHSSAQFNNILSIIPLLLPGLEAELASGKRGMIALSSGRDK